jgi:hypothetical protein
VTGNKPSSFEQKSQRYKPLAFFIGLGITDISTTRYSGESQPALRFFEA